MYNKDEKLGEFLKGKRIAIVGAAPHLMGTGLGEIIDKYDLICRVHQIPPVPTNRFVDYGSRTDILITSFNDKWIEIYKKAIETEYMRNLKYVIIPKYHYGGGHRCIFPEINKYNIPYHIANDEWYAELNKIVGMKTVNTGIASIALFLNYDIAELFVAGFSFYNMGKSCTFWDNYYPELAEWSATELGYTENRRGWHDQPQQIKYLLKLWREKQVIVDAYLLEHFSNPNLLLMVLQNHVESFVANTDPIAKTKGPVVIPGPKGIREEREDCFISCRWLKWLE